MATIGDSSPSAHGDAAAQEPLLPDHGGTTTLSPSSSSSSRTSRRVDYHCGETSNLRPARLSLDSPSSSTLEYAGGDSVAAELPGDLVKKRGAEAKEEAAEGGTPNPHPPIPPPSPPPPSVPASEALSPRPRPLKFLGTSWWTLPSSSSTETTAALPSVLLGGHLRSGPVAGGGRGRRRGGGGGGGDSQADRRGAGGGGGADDENESSDEQRRPFLLTRDGSLLSRQPRDGTTEGDSNRPFPMVALILVLAVVWPLGYASFGKLQTLTDSTFEPVPGTPSRLAQDAFEALYRPPSAPCPFEGGNATGPSRGCGGDWSDPLNPPLYIVLKAASFPAAASSDTASGATYCPSLIANASSPAYQAARKYGSDLRSLLQSHRWSWRAPSPKSGNRSSTSPRTVGGNNGSDALWFQFSDYYTLVEQDLAWMARSAFASPDGCMVLASVQYSFPTPRQQPPAPPPPTAAPLRAGSKTRESAPVSTSTVGTSAAKSRRQNRDRIREVMGAIDAFNRGYSLSVSDAWFTIHPTGLPWLQSDLSASARQDVRRMDWLVLPAAYVLLGFALRGSNPATLWIVPALALVTTVCLWSIVMCPVAARFQITQFTPTIMMSLSLGLGIDYALFLLARYLEVVAKDPLPGGESSVSPPPSRADAIAHMLAQGGKVILVSGSTLICTFLGLCMLPLPMLRSVGVGSAVAVSSALAVNLTLVPAVLASPLGEWIVRRRRPPGQVTGNQADIDQGILAETQAVSVASERSHRRLHDSSRSSALLPAQPPSMWHWLSNHLLHPYRGIILLLATIQLLIPFAMYAGKVKSSISFDLFIPRSSPALQVFHLLGEQVGYGRMNPVRILFDARFVTGNATQSMTSEGGFSAMHLVVDELLKIEASAMSGTTPSLSSTTTGATKLSGAFRRLAPMSRRLIARSLSADTESRVDVASHLIQRMSSNSTAGDPAYLWHQRDDQRFDFVPDRRNSGGRGRVVPPPLRKPSRTVYNGIAVLQNTRIPHSVFVTAKLCSQMKPHCPLELLHVIDAVDRVSTSPDGGRATYVTATLGVDPFSDQGVAWLVSARRLIDQLEESGKLQGVKVHVQGTAAIEHDAQQAVYRSFPWMVLITTVAVFLLMGASFRSVFLPLRSVFSIGLTLAFTFGLSVLVYQNGIAEWTGIQALSASHHEFCWLAPVMAFSLIVGLALDYDVFLVSRVLEYRLDGYEHKSSIAAALHSTGGIITAAGVIMAVAFGSLLFSPSPVLCQWSFLITAAVLVDTFLVRSIIVPIVTSLAGGGRCFWPRVMPEPRVTMPEFLGGMNDVSGLLRTLERSSEYESLRQASAFASGSQ